VDHVINLNPLVWLIVFHMIAANRRVEENAMWARRRAELGQEETSGKEDSDEARKGRECLRSDEKSMKSDGRVEEMQESAFRAWIESAPKKGRGSVGSALADGKEEYMVGQHRKEYFSSGEESNLSLESNDSIRKKKKRKKKRHKERDDGSRKSKKRHHKHRREHKEKRRRKREQPSK